MLQILTGFPDDTLGVSASGEVKAQDYRDVLVPATLAKFKNHERVNLYYQIGPGFTGFSAGAMWEDSKIGIAHWRGWGRIAIVTDVKWITDSVRLFAPVFHGPVRGFGNQEAELARAWIAEKETAPA